MARMSVEERFWPKVDKSGDCWMWTAAKREYGQFKVDGKMLQAHRVAFELTNGPIPPGHHVDHICHNVLCVRPNHLRSTTPKQNAENRSGARAGSKSGVWGVSWHSQKGKWYARVKHNGIDHALGLFESISEAETAVKAKRLELFTHNDLDRSA